MSNIDKSLLNVNDLLLPFEDSQGYYQWDYPIVLSALILGDQWLLAHHLDLHLLPPQIWVIGFIHELELNQLLLTGVVRHCPLEVRHNRMAMLQQGSAAALRQVHQRKLRQQQLEEPPLV